MPLGAAQSIPIGSVIDAQNGVVELTTAVNAAGKLQSATLWHGSFAVGAEPGQRHDDVHASASARLRARDVRARSAATAARSGASPALWAKDNHGQYSTRGQNSVATVRGTYWETINRCDGTLTTSSRALSASAICIATARCSSARDTATWQAR